MRYGDRAVGAAGQEVDVGHGPRLVVLHMTSRRYCHWRRTKEAKGPAMRGGRRGGSRRVTQSTAASTEGTGRNAVAGTRWTTSNDHHGAQAVDSSVDGGMRARLRATSHCTMRSARTRYEPGLSSRWRRIDVVAPNGSEPMTRYGRRGMR